MNGYFALLACCIGYLCGAAPFTKIISRLFYHNSVPDELEVEVPGSNVYYNVTSAGAAAASMTLGARAGCMIGILDMLKIAVPTLGFKLAFDQPEYYMIAAGSGMIGHNWPVFNRFRGGRGISSVYGAMFVIDWIGAFAIAGGGLLIGLAVFRDFIIAYLAGLWLLIPWMWFRFHDWTHLGFAIGVNLIFIIAMLPDLRQYLRFKREGKADIDIVMNKTPMGRGMLKIMHWLKIKRKRSA